MRSALDGKPSHLKQVTVFFHLLVSLNPESDHWAPVRPVISSNNAFFVV